MRADISSEDGENDEELENPRKRKKLKKTEERGWSYPPRVNCFVNYLTLSFAAVASTY